MDLEPPKPRQPVAQSSRGGLLTSILLIAVIAMATLQVRAWWINHTNTAINPRAVSPRGDLGSDEQATIEIFEAASPSVVFITTANFRRDYFSQNIHKIPRGTGSGFIWDKAGHIVTNYHVIQGADQATVTLWDNSTWDAKVVGTEPDKDLAVLKIQITLDRTTPIKIGTSHDLRVGQKALAIGNPFGLDQTLTTGVISALGREISSVTRHPIVGVIQTDAAINPGNSGGPLLDSAGRLIGINTAISSPTGADSGIGFAVPVDTVNRIVPQLIEHGKVIKPGLGINLANDSFVRNNLKTTGILVLNVIPGSGAEKAGIEATKQTANGRTILGDIIKEIDGRVVENSTDLFRILDNQSVGDTISVTVERNGKKRKLKVTLGALNG
ncbi:MAG: PDZ domain-containing protein [Verrucomicrobiaceae bacterium]|nr:PDZ domain-containing protein [Verrucomicrobiaceae bacterium]